MHVTIIFHAFFEYGSRRALARTFESVMMPVQWTCFACCIYWKLFAFFNPTGFSLVSMFFRNLQLHLVLRKHLFLTYFLLLLLLRLHRFLCFVAFFVCFPYFCIIFFLSLRYILLCWVLLLKFVCRKVCFISHSIPSNICKLDEKIKKATKSALRVKRTENGDGTQLQ